MIRGRSANLMWIGRPNGMMQTEPIKAIGIDWGESSHWTLTLCHDALERYLQ